jgi:hypothetical protein
MLGLVPGELDPQFKPDAKSGQSSKIQAHKTGGSKHSLVVKVHMYVRTSRIQNPKKKKGCSQNFITTNLLDLIKLSTC